MASDGNSGRGRSGKATRKHLRVICSQGIQHRFLRGMITHDLMQRGLPFDEAYAAARAVRGQLSGRDTVSTSELRDLIQQHLVKVFGPDVETRLEVPLPPPDLQVIYQGQTQPFSKGLLARSIHAAGIGMDQAYELVSLLQAQLREDAIAVLPTGELVRRVAALLHERVGEEPAKRYQLIRRIQRLHRPLVVYIGGASGTGKSTLALELAPLLKVYRITATDTVRQVMRMVFSPNILPALHTSSFETRAEHEWSIGEPHDPEQDGRQRLVSSFEEQSTRVLVGVRAVVERAITENMNIVVEGVHLYPPAIPFADLESSTHQVPLMLATLDEDTHRSRFVTRARRGGRKAERFLRNFSAIRGIQDFLLQQVEQYETPFLDTTIGESLSLRATRLFTGALERQIPAGPRNRSASGKLIPTLMVVIDGLADRPVRALGGRTPLQAADTPTLDRLAQEGQSGLADPVAPGVVPDTAAGTLALLAQSPDAMQRGPVEAMGAGIKMIRRDVAVRANLATVEDGLVVDRRAGRIRGEAVELAAAIDGQRLKVDGEKIEFIVRAATEHRLAVVLRGRGLSSAIHGSDPGEGAVPGPPLEPRPLDPDDEVAARTAEALSRFEAEAARVLEAHPINRERVADGLPAANAVLSRGAGSLHALVPLEDAGMPLRFACVAGDRTILGLAEHLGGKAISDPRLTANLDTDLRCKFELAAAALVEHDMVIVHVKGADIAAHDRRPDVKAEFLESVDRELGRFLDSFEGPLRVAVTADHATLSESGQHSADPLPVLIWGEGIDRTDDVQSFDEHAAAAGALQRFPLQTLLTWLFDLT